MPREPHSKKHPAPSRALAAVPCSLTLDDPRLREIICFLKHSDMKVHACWLAKRFTTMGLMETKRWVEELKHPMPVSVAGWLRKDKESENDQILP